MAILSFLQNNLGTIIVGLIVFGIAFMAFRHTFIKKKNCCGGDCSSCKGCH